MSSLLVIGECMMELRANTLTEEATFKRTFAGDSYNTAVYAKRFLPSMHTAYFSAVGNDPISSEMLSQWHSEGIDSALCLRVENALPGIYAITIDDTGERQFLYWRKNSAATQMMQALEKDGDNNALLGFDTVYFSGISLAVLSDADKAQLLSLIATLKAQGAIIAFDPNYRPAMWESTNHAQKWITQAYQCSDIVFPGLDDHQALFQHNNQQDIQHYLAPFNITEVIIKCGEDGIYGYQSNQFSFHLPFTPAKQQVDTTAAGDSFSGTYIAARNKGMSCLQATESATTVAAIVVQHPGAIIDHAIYKQAL